MDNNEQPFAAFLDKELFDRMAAKAKQKKQPDFDAMVKGFAELSVRLKCLNTALKTVGLDKRTRRDMLLMFFEMLMNNV